MQANIVTPLTKTDLTGLTIKNKELLLGNKALYLQTSKFVAIQSDESGLLIDFKTASADSSTAKNFSSNLTTIDNYFRDTYLKTVSQKMKFLDTIKMNKLIMLKHNHLTRFFNHYGEPMKSFKTSDYPNSFPALTEDNEITGYAIIKPMRLIKDRAGNFSLEWSVLQIRLTLPLPTFEECMLNQQDNCYYDDIGDADGEEYFESI